MKIKIKAKIAYLCALGRIVLAASERQNVGLVGSRMDASVFQRQKVLARSTDCFWLCRVLELEENCVYESHCRG